MQYILFKGYKHIGITKGVCGNNPIVVGTRLEPDFIIKYGTKKEVIEDYNLTVEQVEEAYRFYDELNGYYKNRK